MTEENNELTQEEKDEFSSCVKDIFCQIEEVLDKDERTDYSTRVYFIAKSIARMQPSDIEMTQCLRFIIDAFTDEIESYVEFRKVEEEKMNQSLGKFRDSVGKEVNYFNDESNNERTLN